MASGKTVKVSGRGARAPRSAFRGKPKAKARPAKAKAKPAKAKAKAKAKPAKAKAKPAKAKATLPAPALAVEELGTITCPSGTLGIVDIGLAGYLPREALEPAIVKAPVPADRALRVTGTRVGHGRFASAWDHVAIALGDGEVHGSMKLGEAGVDFARLACIDLGALAHWQHEDSLDGRADVVFWGRDEAALARVLGAQRLPDGHGWIDLPVADAEARYDDAARRKAANKWLLTIDYRPHSHHYAALAAARAHPLGAGTLEVGGARMLLFFTTWGDGVFPIFLDLDIDEQPVRVRIQLATPASTAAMSVVNPPRGRRPRR